MKPKVSVRKGNTVTPAFMTPYDDLRSRTIGGESCVIVRRCTTSQPSGVSDVQKPGYDSKHRRVSQDNLARSYEVTRRCTTSPHNIY